LVFLLKNKIIMAKLLRNGHTKSCGCLFLEGNNYKHGYTGTSEYIIWLDMKARCYNVNYPAYNLYGQRKITICDEWKNDFSAFLRDMGEKTSPKHSIERINTNGNYCKENCKWATSKEQANNKRNNHILEYNNEKLTMKQWSEKLNINYDLIKQRINKLHWTTERALKALNIQAL